MQIPDFYIVNGTRWETKDLIFNPNWIYQYGTREILHSFGRQVAGKIGLRNHGKILMPVLMKVGSSFQLIINMIIYILIL